MVHITEKLVKDRIKDIIKLYLRYNPIYTLCPMTFGYGERGHPDRIILVNGAMLGIEAKKDANNPHTRPELKPRPNEAAQQIQARHIKSAGGDWLCIHSGNLQEFADWLDAHAETPSAGMDAKHREALAKLLTFGG